VDSAYQQVARNTDVVVTSDADPLRRYGRSLTWD